MPEWFRREASLLDWPRLLNLTTSRSPRPGLSAGPVTRAHPAAMATRSSRRRRRATTSPGRAGNIYAGTGGTPIETAPLAAAETVPAARAGWLALPGARLAGGGDRGLPEGGAGVSSCRRPISAPIRAREPPAGSARWPARPRLWRSPVGTARRWRIMPHARRSPRRTRTTGIPLHFRLGGGGLLRRGAGGDRKAIARRCWTARRG